MKEKDLQHIYDSLKVVFNNLKAEVLLAELMENSDIELSNVNIRNQSTFSRSHRRDVMNLRLIENKDSQRVLNFDLARNGLYDNLPEGIFHDPISIKSNVTYKALRQKQKKQEREARSLFEPLENEFFTQRLKIEQNERELNEQFSKLKNDFLVDFWKIRGKLPKKYTIKLLSLLPQAYKIAGNISLTARCLQHALGYKVQMIKSFETIEEHIKPVADNSQLGVDFVLALNETQVLYPKIKIIVGPVNNKELSNYVEGGVARKFISIFCDYFVPIEYDTQVEIIAAKDKNTFALNLDEQPVMGITTTI
ncbi:hypothetical protein [Spongiivirga citrea]|uniref:Type VI secretion system baseplate subunit TssG n=1 Tax=Spongiivirga citrea TaxID=1481457 RepID=A0A6M0CMH7_9FLAO|nr:hypothetical protein [Spongiivirga citrea]NER19145.1 hypothetical protein [Spongiivirga citrea]